MKKEKRLKVPESTKDSNIPPLPKEIDMSEFKYFIANELIVFGVHKEDEEFAYFVVIKSKDYKQGTVGKFDKKFIQKEIEDGLSVLIKDPIEAANYGE